MITHTDPTVTARIEMTSDSNYATATYATAKTAPTTNDVHKYEPIYPLTKAELIVFDTEDDNTTNKSKNNNNNKNHMINHTTNATTNDTGYALAHHVLGDQLSSSRRSSFDGHASFRASF